MLNKLRIAYLFVLLAILVAPTAPVLAQTPAPVIPDGFQLLLAEGGVALYQKNYANGSPDFVQTVDLKQGAALRLLYAPIAEPRHGLGVYGGDDPRFGLQPLSLYWRQASQANDTAFCVTNGQFFYMPEAPTRLAFPLKVDGQIITDGWAIQQYPDQKLMLELWDDHADIVPLTKEALYSSQAPDIIAGLTEEANKRAKFAVGRTFFGIQDKDQDGTYETVLVANTQIASQVDIAGVLRAWGADKVMMLDGGGSTQLTCKGTPYISSERLIPQAIAILSAVPPAVAAEVVQKQPIWVSAVEGQPVQFQVELKNTGQETWQAGQHQVVLSPGPLNSKMTLDFKNNIEPGQTVTLTLKLMSYWQAGTYPEQINWEISRQGKSFPIDQIQLNTIVLPQKLGDQQVELDKELARWSDQPQADVTQQVQSWQKAQSPPPTVGEVAAENVKNVLWVPALMMPFLLLIFANLMRGRH
jgi:Phosphodiester glycosidase